MALGVLVAPGTRASAPVTAAVVDFANQTGDGALDAVGRGLADMVTTDLSGVDGLTLVERARLEAVLGELKLQRSRFVDKATAQKLGKGLGATHVVTGALAAVKPTIRLDIRMVAVATGEVVLADSVTGSADRFFELQSKLMDAFGRALAVKLASSGGAGRVDRLGSVQAYGQALRKADAGDLKGASRQLAQIVRKEPRFALGQKRYTEVLRRLHAARDRREDAVSDLDRRLQARVKEELAGKRIGKLGPKAASRYLAYRVLAGNLLLRQLRDRLGPADDEGRRPVPAAAKDAVAGLVKRYAENTDAFIAELQAWRAGQGKPYHELRLELTDADGALAERAGLGGSAGDWSFATPSWVMRSLAEFLFEGKPDHYGDVGFTMTPSPAQAAPSWRARGHALLEAALAEVDGPVPADDKADMGARVLHTWARALRREGRTAEAIAHWQMILDRYPTHEDYAEYETLIRRVLAGDLDP